MRFEKWQALGNDYAIVEEDALPFELTPERVRALCAPHTGVGSDGVLLLSAAAERGFAAELRIFNPDGSEAELSGNGVREAVLYLRRNGWVDATPSRSRPPPARCARGSPVRPRAPWTWAARASPRPRTSRREREDGRGDAVRRRTRAAASSSCRSATRSARSRWVRSSRSSTWAARAADRAARAVPEPHQRLVLAPPLRHRDPGADLRARRGGDDVVGHRGHRGGRRGGAGVGSTARSRSSSTAASSRWRSARTCT